MACSSQVGRARQCASAVAAWLLSEKSYARVCALWDEPGRENEPPYFGWLQSALPYVPSTLNLKTSVQNSCVGERPIVTLEPTDHPLAIEQRNGITMARIQQIVEAALHGSG